MARNNSKKSAKGSTGQNRNLTEEFIKKYSAKAGVTATDSGLYFRIIEDADGAKPSEFDTVKIHQRILLADGSVIDDTYRKGLPEEFALAEGIEGLQEGLQLMSKGARYEFVIPPDLAWGRKGNGGKIGPNAVMQMDVRLVDFF
ncbi:FKBP-type peptidyl-prolyl cis-trans isomerase [Shewanella sp. C32]|uniref:Peptidyl-prolyl cis-trans isomerase n=1 Tax=Shewanella electrica TaxID=515560 RepID=A0ABT2FKX9_9GAMM|nr:FKBP-type peptidyl-prolyl cis-trans isomerase [Shewanella electrica]MCH1924001.1 FKBP-type peptidyl-prolyl cis-trans isomerase [Shewanella electrica]MCS4555904.1 FKBP-type peptidyl-prolyl cis-trans isomerase [Shewanella electrica]